MSVQTEYDRKRDELRDKLRDCLNDARELLDPNIWGYDDMKPDYAIDVYKAIQNAFWTV